MTKPGDVVRYKADGTKMVVVGRDRFASSYQERWECSWIQDGHRRTGSFQDTEFTEVRDDKNLALEFDKESGNWKAT